MRIQAKRRTEKGESMPRLNTNDFAQEVVLLEDRYPATLKEVTEYEKDYGDGPVAKLAWVFTVEAGKEAIDPDIQYEEEVTGFYDIAAHTSFATGPNSNFAKLNFPAFVGEDWSGETDDLLGKPCIVDVTSYETKGGQTRNVIEKIRAPKKEQKGKTKKESAPKNGKEEVELNEADFDSIPF